MASGLWLILAAAGTMMLAGSLRLNSQSTDNDQAVLLATEGLEAVRTIKKNGWMSPFLATDCLAGCGVATVSGTWGFGGSSNTIGKYTRKITVSPVSRDTEGNVVGSGGAVDTNTYKVESKVTWQRTPVVSGSVTLITYLTNYIKSIVSTLTGGLLIYGDGTTVPQYRLFDRVTNFSTEQSGPIGGAGGTFQMDTSPIKTEAVAGYVTGSGALQIMCFDGVTWSNEWSVNVGGTASTRRFDVAYENNSGDVLVLYSGNTVSNELRYRVKSGASDCGSSAWSAENSLNSARTNGVIHWVKMAVDRRLSSDLIGAIWADENADLSSMVWNGSAWVNEPSALLATDLEVVSTAQDVEDFDLEYESLSGDLMVVWAISAGNNGTNGVRYATCTGGTANCTWTLNLTPPTFKDDATNLDLAADPITDQLVFASIGDAGSDLQIGFWDGTGWSNKANLDTSAGTPLAGTKIVSSGWLASGTTSRFVVVYTDSSESGINWYVSNAAGVPNGQKEFLTLPVIGYPKKWIEIKTDPVDKAQLIAVISDVNNDLYAKKLFMTTKTAFEWSDLEGGTALETGLTQSINKPFAFSFWKQ